MAGKSDHSENKPARLLTGFTHLANWFSICLSIAWKETKNFYVSWMAYIVTSAFLLIIGYIFYIIVKLGQVSAMPAFYGNMAIILLMIIPMITMRLLAEERKTGTLELMLTSPVTDWQTVLGKFLGAMNIVLVMIALSLYAPLLMLKYGTVDLGPYGTSYIGLIAICATMVAIGVFWSSCTDSQIVAAVATFGTLLFLWIIGWSESQSWLGELCSSLSIQRRFEGFSTGLMQTRDLVFYASCSIAALFLSVRALESRRWR